MPKPATPKTLNIDRTTHVIAVVEMGTGSGTSPWAGVGAGEIDGDDPSHTKAKCNMKERKITIGKTLCSRTPLEPMASEVSADARMRPQPDSTFKTLIKRIRRRTF